MIANNDNTSARGPGTLCTLLSRSQQEAIFEECMKDIDELA